MLHNTSFGILSSDGKRKLSRTGRSPGMVYGDAETFEAALREIAEKEETDAAPAIRSLPTLPDLRIALDVAAADLRPLVILYTEGDDDDELGRAVETLAWSDDFIGRMRYVRLDGADALEGFESIELEPGISVVQAEAYGRSGEVLAHAGPDTSESTIAKALRKGLSRFDANAKDVRRHLREGERQGIAWESAIPVSDPKARD